MNTIDKFRRINNTFPKTDEISAIKSDGKKIFGWLCTYVPEEILHAAGIFPVRITGYTQETDLDDGTAYLYANNCSFSRSCLQLGLRGGYDYLDGVVGGSTCDGARRLFDLWRHYIGTSFHHVLTVPRKYTAEAHELYYIQVKELKTHVEEFSGITISDEALINSTHIYNKSRELLGKLYDLRKLDRPPITGAETLEVLNASFRMPKESFNIDLQDLLNELVTKTSTKRYRARLAIIGSVLNNPDFIKAIEDEGGLVVTDELCTSTRYWSDPVILDGTDPLRAICKRYLNNFPCARMYPSEERFNRIIDLVHDFRVDGVINQIIRYCVPYAHDTPLLTDRLKQINTPVLSLDVEYGTSGSGQIRTRVQAFLEMMENKKNARS
ncbi:MAG: 2-hydroxyacyl-CoA dehydratase family protein [Chloroflexi bacterium]|nr:2-hydroxyacyl-CoA dehydratase family protein [Chloroflexota bacterium]